MTLSTPARPAVILAAAGVAAALAAGCNSLETSTNAQLAPETRQLPVAAATQPGDTARPVRDWDKSVATYQNGDTASGSTGVRYISDVGQLFGRGGRTTRSDVVASGGGSNTTPIAGSGVGATGASASAGGTGGAGIGATGTGGVGTGTVASNIGGGTFGAGTGSAQTPAVASGNTVNGQVVRGDGSLAPVGSPGAAGTTGSIAAQAGGVSQSVAAQDVAAAGGDTVNAGQTDSAAARNQAAPGTPGGELSTGETIAAGAALPFVETGVFLANVVTSPVTFWQQRDGIVSGGYQFPQTYTAMPALPPEPARQPRKVAPPAVAAPAVPLAPRVQYPSTTPAATRLSAALPTTTPITPVPPSTMPTQPEPRPLPAAPATRPANERSAAQSVTIRTAAAPAAPAAQEGRKPGTLKRAAEVSATAFSVVGAPYAGRYEVEPGLTLENVLRGAGVVPADASSVTVKIQRRGQPAAAAVPLTQVRARTGDDALVKPGDVITVTTR